MTSIYTFSGKFPTNLTHSQETFFLVCFSVKTEILNSRPVKLEKRNSFAGFFFENVKVLERLFLSERSQKKNL